MATGNKAGFIDYHLKLYERIISGKRSAVATSLQKYKGRADIQKPTPLTGQGVFASRVSMILA